MNFEGTIQRDGKFYCTYSKERQIIEDTYTAKIFEGNIQYEFFNSGKRDMISKPETNKNKKLLCSGNIYEDGPNGREQKNDTFLVDFTPIGVECWEGDYYYKEKLNKVNMFLKRENDKYEGLGFESIKGFFLVSGSIETVYSIIKIL